MITTVSVGIYFWLRPSPLTVNILPHPQSTATATTTIINIGELPYKGLTPTASPENSGTPVPTGGTPTSVPVVNPVGPGPGGCTANSPYGFTTPYADTRLLPIYIEMGICWLRFQIHENDMRLPGGGYDWSQLDTVVDMMNKAGIHLDVPIQCFTGPGTGCFGSDPYIPNPQEVANFASQVASRYNGKTGHGYIASFEIGNEEYDTNSSFSYTNYGPLLKAGYQAIKAVHPNAQVGMYGHYIPNPKNTTELLTAIYQGGYGGYMDFMNFHYYNGGYDPTTTIDKFHPSFEEKWRLMQGIAAKYGYANKPIWLTEVGWPTRSLGGLNVVSPETQARYMQYVTDRSAKSGIITKIFWFTVNFGEQPNNIYPPGGPLPAFFTLRDFVKQQPLW